MMELSIKELTTIVVKIFVCQLQLSSEFVFRGAEWLVQNLKASIPIVLMDILGHKQRKQMVKGHYQHSINAQTW